MDENSLDLEFCIIAQPKAGSTWLVHLLSSIINPEYSFSDLEKYIPLVKTPKPGPYRIHKPAPNPTKKNIHLIRNPIDSHASWYNYHRLRGGRISPKFNFAPYYKDMGKNVLVVRYEDLNLETFDTMDRIVNYLGWKLSCGEIQDAIAKCQIHILQDYENLTLEKDRKFLFYSPKAQLEGNYRFYNKGKAYSFSETLDKDTINRLYKEYNYHINKYWPEINDYVHSSI